MNKLILTGLLAFSIVAPAMAETITTAPANGYMKNATNNNGSNTYSGAASASLFGNADITNNKATANPWYTLNAGYYLRQGQYAAEACPEGSYCTGGGTVSYDNTQNQGVSGLVAKDYYATKGATKSQPTSNSDCVDGGVCGICLQNYNGAKFQTSGTGAKSYTECYNDGTVQCSAVFPITNTGVSTGTVYTSDSIFNPSTDYRQSSNITTAAVYARRYQVSPTGVGSFVPNDPLQCLVRSATCPDYYHPNATEFTNDSSAWSHYTESGHDDIRSDADAYYASGSVSTKGTFSVTYASGTVVHGVWMNGKYTGTGGNVPTYDASGTTCFCQIAGIKQRDANTTERITSGWFEGSSTSGTCGDRCISVISNANNLKSLTLKSSSVALYTLGCALDRGWVMLNGAGADGGQIAGQNAKVNGNYVNIIGSCPLTNKVAGVMSWNAGSNTLVKDGHIFIGWSEAAGCDDTSSTNECDSAEHCAAVSCLTTKKCEDSDVPDKVFYAAWAEADCYEGEKAIGLNVKAILNNRVYCSISNKAGYYCPVNNVSGVPDVTPGEVIESGLEGVAKVYAGSTCQSCPSNWTSDANAANAINDCKRSLTLDKNGATENLTTASKTCYYGTDCTVPVDATGGKFTKAGYRSTGWGLSSDCTSTSNVVNTTSTDANQKIYICWAANTIEITWTGVSAIPSSGFSAITSSHTSKSSVSYGGNIVTPTGVLKSDGQTFLGWKFVQKAQ